MNGLPSQRWSLYEIGFWLLPVIAFFAFPKYLTLGSQILIAGIFALYSGLALILATGILIAPVVHRLMHRFHVETEKEK